jgi:hypothetical protein
MINCQYDNINISWMKFLVFLMMVVALTALNLASHDRHEPEGACQERLQKGVVNENGTMVIRPGGKYDESCYAIFI